MEHKIIGVFRGGRNTEGKELEKFLNEGWKIVSAVSDGSNYVQYILQKKE